MDKWRPNTQETDKENLLNIRLLQLIIQNLNRFNFIRLIFGVKVIKKIYKDIERGTEN